MKEIINYRVFDKFVYNYEMGKLSTIPLNFHFFLNNLILKMDQRKSLSVESDQQTYQSFVSKIPLDF